MWARWAQFKLSFCESERVSRFTGEDRIVNSSRLELSSLAKSSKQESVQGLQAELLILLFFPDGSISTQYKYTQTDPFIDYIMRETYKHNVLARCL